MTWKWQGNHVIQVGGGLSAASSRAAPALTVVVAKGAKAEASGEWTKSMSAGQIKQKKVHLRMRMGPSLNLQRYHRLQASVWTVHLQHVRRHTPLGKISPILSKFW
jgi:hypothetical protein